MFAAKMANKRERRLRGRVQEAAAARARRRKPEGD